MNRLVKTLTSKNARTTAIYYVGNFVLNIGRYCFHLILLRFLSPGEYGEFLSYLSLTYLLGIPMGTISNVVVKYVSDFNGKGDNRSINHFFYFLLKKVSPITFGLGLLLIIFSNQLSIIFKAHSIAFIVLGVSMFISLFQAIIGSYIAAFQKFIFQTVIGYLSVFLTIVFSIIFINLHFGATGAVLGQLVAGIVTTIIIFLKIKSSIVPEQPGKENFKINLSSFTGYSLIYSLGTMSLISTDILLVRFLFDATTSGIYSSLSILGRMIFFGLSPLTGLALPIATHRYVSTGSARSIFIKLGSVLLLFGLIGAGIFTLFPNLIISLLSGSNYLSAAPLLPVFAFAMVFFALSQFTISYLMATGRPQANILLLIATILQPVMYLIFRNSFTEVVWSNLFIQLALLSSLIVYLFVKKSTNTASVKLDT
jgi:O-antigen/teichoic acid export membrane protein